MSTEPVTWRTDTVIALCQAMRETQDYSGLPILADALEEGGYPYPDILTAVRAGRFSHPDGAAEKFTARVYSAETCAATDRIEELAGLFQYSYETMIRTGKVFIATGKSYSDGDNWAASYAIDDPEVREEYWKNFELATGARVPDGYRSLKPFVCSC